jgi:hypothetical protein
MKTFGIIEQKRLISLPDDGTGNPDWMSAAPDGMYTADDPRAPWNAPDPEPPAADPEAPEQPQPEPINRDPDAYPGVLWTPPDVIPFVKLPAPSVPAGKVADPVLVWHAERVERDWSIRDMTDEELAASTRKVWADAGEFFAEFTDAEQEGIATSTHPVVGRLRLMLATWRARLFSDDPRVAGGLQLLEAVGILTTARKLEILTKPTP